MRFKAFPALALAGLALIIACNKEFAGDDAVGPVTISAQLPDTRTVLGGKDGDSYPIFWSDGDAIAINGKGSDVLAGVPADCRSADFTLDGITAPFNAAYPSDAVSGYASGEASITLPAEQRWIQGTYDPAAFIMLGRSDNSSVHFKPAVFVFRITPVTTGGRKIKSVSVSALSPDVKLSGTFTTDFVGITPSDGASGSVCVTAESGVDAGEAFYLVMAPADFREDGFRIVLTDTEGGTMTRTARPDKAYEAGKLYTAEIEYTPSAQPVSFPGSASSSSLSFTWTFGEGADYDISRSYKIGLYADAACSRPVVEYDIPAGNACWNEVQPRFVFGGLQQDTDYWFKAIDKGVGDGSGAYVVKSHTESFNIVTMPSEITETGVVLAEDFGELPWDYDYVDQAAGCRPTAPSSMDVRQGSFTKFNQGGELPFYNYSAPLSTTRLAEWAASTKVYMKPGYIKTGKADTRGWILTPEFTIPAGRVATVSVTVTGARYSEAQDDWSVAVLTRDQAGVSGTTANITWPTVNSNNHRTVSLTESTEWQTRTVSGLLVRSGDRIAFGSLYNGDSKKSRGFISDITVEVTSISEASGSQDGSVHGYVRGAGKPLQGVVVSDGYLTTSTDSDGHYILNSEKKNGYIFVTLPSGYTAERSGVLPQFYRYTAAPADEGEQIDFDLLQDPGQDNHTMLVFGDIHLANRNKDKTQFATFTDDVKSYITAHPSEKVYAMTLGDMSWDAYWYNNKFDLSNYLTLAKAVPGLSIFHSIGNHDHDMNATGDWDTSLAFKRIIGPNWYSFNIGKIHYIILDDIECTNPTASTTDASYRSYNTKVVADIINWLKRDLSYVPKSTPVVVGMHAPVWNEDGSGYLSGASTLTSCFTGFEDVLFVTGHTHIHRKVFKTSMTEYNTGAVCAAWWWAGKFYSHLNVSTDGSPGGYRIMKYEGTQRTSRYKGTGRAEEYQFRCYDRNTVTAGLEAGTVGVTTYAAAYNEFLTNYGGYDVADNSNTVIINVWDYDPRWKVQASEDNVTFTDCTATKGYDPMYILAYSAPRFKSTSSPNFSPKYTSHLFTYKASAANTTVYVKVTDDEGRVYTETMTRPRAFKTVNY